MSNSSRNIVIAVLSLLLLASLGGNVFQYFHTREVIVEREKILVQADSIAMRKNELEVEYNSAIEELNQYKGKSAQMDSLLAVANAKIEEQHKKISQLIAKNEDYQIVRQRLDEMRLEKEFYLKEIERLTTENNMLKSENNTLSVKLDQTSQENKDLKGKVDVASKLRMVSVTPKPVNLTNSGKEKDTDKANKTDRLSIAFTIGDNPLAQTGNHTVYLRVFNSEGYILSDGSVKKFKNESGEDIPYSRSIQVNYDGNKLSKVITWEQDAFSSGVYRVELYIDSYLAGSEKVTLY
jgi:hypothetical protein